MRRSFSFIAACLFLTVFSVKAQSPRPKLVVGIVVDQMRWDYLYHFQSRYGETGFKRLLKDGFSCEQTMIPYLPTYTAPGHTCIFTGSVPAIHGIVGNNWYRRGKGDTVYCSDDKTVSPVGGSFKSGMMSPLNLLATTIGDELRLSNNFQSKVFGVALKDRGSIFPAGRSANGAYWYDDSTGNWMTSSWYMDQLPDYVRDFNAKQLSRKYLQQNWNTLYPISSYVLSTADNMPYELHSKYETLPVFPHLSEKALLKQDYKEMRYVAAGNTLTVDFARTVIEGEDLGRRGVTDFFEMSFSSTDYIGHRYGVNSIELEDTYLRLDKELGDFLNWLDARFGKGQYLVFLSADHGAQNAPDFMNEHKIAAGVFDYQEFRTTLNSELDSIYKIKKAVTYFNNFQLYLDTAAINASPNAADVYNHVRKYCYRHDWVQEAFYLRDLNNVLLPNFMATMVKNGYNSSRSGDLQIICKPGWFESGDHASTHGVPLAYDRHIPLLFFGWNIKPGKLYREVYMTDIAPTICALLQIQMPNGNVGKVITELAK